MPRAAIIFRDRRAGACWMPPGVRGSTASSIPVPNKYFASVTELPLLLLPLLSPSSAAALSSLASSPKSLANDAKQQQYLRRLSSEFDCIGGIRRCPDINQKQFPNSLYSPRLNPGEYNGAWTFVAAGVVFHHRSNMCRSKLRLPVHVCDWHFVVKDRKLLARVNNRQQVVSYTIHTSASVQLSLAVICSRE